MTGKHVSQSRYRSLQEFTNSEYKSHIRVIGYKVYDKFIHIMFDGEGETVKMEKYYEWLINRRNIKIESIGI